MERIAVESSALKSVGYDADSKILEVEFHGKNGAGKVWQYCPVPLSVFSEMMQPGVSIGKVFASQVRANPSVSAVELDPAV